MQIREPSVDTSLSPAPPPTQTPFWFETSWGGLFRSEFNPPPVPGPATEVDQKQVPKLKHRPSCGKAQPLRQRACSSGRARPVFLSPVLFLPPRLSNWGAAQLFFVKPTGHRLLGQNRSAWGRGSTGSELAPAVPSEGPEQLVCLPSPPFFFFKIFLSLERREKGEKEGQK